MHVTGVFFLLPANGRNQSGVFRSRRKKQRRVKATYSKRVHQEAMKRSSSKCSPLSDGPDLRCHAPTCRLEKNVASWISLSPLSRPHPSPLFFFYQQQWVHFTARKMIKAMQIGLKLCRRWRAERDRSLLPLELKDLILNLYVPPEAWESSHPSFGG